MGEISSRPIGASSSTEDEDIYHNYFAVEYIPKENAVKPSFVENAALTAKRGLIYTILAFKAYVLRSQDARLMLDSFDIESQFRDIEKWYTDGQGINHNKLIETRFRLLTLADKIGDRRWGLDPNPQRDAQNVDKILQAIEWIDFESSSVVREISRIFKEIDQFTIDDQAKIDEFIKGFKGSFFEFKPDDFMQFRKALFEHQNSIQAAIKGITPDSTLYKTQQAVMQRWNQVILSNPQKIAALETINEIAKNKISITKS